VSLDRALSDRCNYLITLAVYILTSALGIAWPSLLDFPYRTSCEREERSVMLQINVMHC